MPTDATVTWSEGEPCPTIEADTLSALLRELFKMSGECLPPCDENVFDSQSGVLLGAHRRAQHNIAIELEQLGDKIEQHRVAIMLLERRREYLLAQANEDVPMAGDQNK